MSLLILRLTNSIVEAPPMKSVRELELNPQIRPGIGLRSPSLFGLQHCPFVTATIVLEDICTTKGQQRCLFDALPAGRLREFFSPLKEQEENIGSGTGSQFHHHTSGSPTTRFPPFCPAPCGHLLHEPVDPEHCLVNRAAPT